MNTELKCLSSRGNRFEVLVREIMKTLYMERSEALAMADDMFFWELVISARTAGMVPEATQSAA
jgi:hypothetical protein